MRKIYLSFAVFTALLTSFTTFSQTNHVPTAGATETFNVFAGDHFFDPGGPGGSNTGGTAGNYPNCGCDTKTTLIGATQIEFLAFNVFANFDYLQIYDGTDDTGTLLYDNGTSGSPNYNDVLLADMIASHGSAVFTSTTGNFHFVFHASTVVDKEGWDVVIQNAPVITCPAPTNLTVSNIQTTSADLGWTEAGTASTWDIEIVPTGTAPSGTPTDSGITSNPFNKTGLTSGTSYDFYVRADCGGGDLSNWTGPFTFLTTCQASTLAITNTTSATINCGGSATLTATSSGTGDEIYWYDAATGGEKVGEGTSFTTPVLDQTTSYWATEVILAGSNYSGIGMTTGSGDTDNYFNDTGLEFTATKSFTIVSVDVYNEDLAAQTVDIQLRDSNDNVLQTHNASLPAGNGTSGGPSAPTTVQLNFLVPGSGTYRLVTANNNADLLQDTNPTFPYPIGPGGSVGQITGGYGSQSNNYNFFYNWEVSTLAPICESTPRTEVIVTVNSGDKTVPSTTTPSVYTDTDDTANFSDSYSGAPGNNCGTTADYLGGNEVVYYYTAGDSYSLNIAMSGLSAGESGVFVYDSCLDIGSNCIEGMTNSTATDYDFDIVVQSGEDYFIVVSSSAATGTLGYTLTLTEGASPCQSLDITASTGGTIPCIGKATLSATGSGIGNEIYWYDAATGGNLVGIGPNFTTTELSTTTSYWAAEVITTLAGGSGQLQSYCVPSFTTGCTSGDQITDFVLTESGGTTVINHIGSGCSPNAYGDFTSDPSLMGTMITGSTYDFNATHDFSGQEMIIWIDFNQDGDFDDPDETVFSNASGSGNSTTGSFVIPNGVLGGNTVMRVMCQFSGLPTDACTSSSGWGEVHDYQVMIIGQSVLCESPREEVIATVNTAGDITVTTPLPYSDTNDTANFGNPYEGTPGDATLCGTDQNYLNGNDVVYHFTAQNTELVDIEMSNLSDFYGAVFVFDSCGDIYTSCLAGAVAGPSDNDFKINDFQVTAGEDYYIVVSSWLSSSIGYTLEIIPFDCANLPAPEGEAAQDFVTGDTVSSLEVDPTENGATLTWYENASDIPGNPITGDPVLINGEDYYVTQTFNGCESPPLVITVNEIDCSMLAITSTTPDSVSCRGKVILGAVGSGQGDDIYWYDVATGGNPVGTGSQFETEELTTTKSYWVAEVFATGMQSSGYGIVSGSGDLDNYYTETGLEFTANQSFTIVSVDVYNEDLASQIVDVELRDSNGTIQAITGISLPAGNGTSGGPSAPTTIQLNFMVPGPGTYQLVTGTTNNADLLQDSSPSFPYPLGPNGNVGQITGGFGSTPSNYNFFYNWTITTGSMICESPRVQVDATVTQSGDVTVDYTDLSYTTTDNTANYGNNFSGDPGTNCNGVDILGGNEVIYRYTADPNSDNILDIELTNISNPNTGMFIYASCGDVGLNCLGGDTNENSTDILIDDYYVTAGTEIFIVISSGAGSTNYTLNINGVDCANIAPPTLSDPNIYFISGDVLVDIESSLDFNQYGTLTWYADPSDIPSNPLDPTTEVIVDGTTYYVTQTILGCESAPFAVTPEEFQCGNMKIDTITQDFTICEPGGMVTLNAEGTGIGNNLYWYDAATGGNVLGSGEVYETMVSTTTSFWVSEVFIDGMAPGSVGPLDPAALGGTGGGTATTLYYTSFEVLQQTTLLSVDVFPTSSGNNASIIIRDTSGNQIIEVPYTTNVSGGSTAQTVPLNVSLSPGDYEMVQGSTTSLFRNTSGASFPYTSPFINILGHSFSNQSYYYYFFNWQYGGGTVVCESARTEVTVTVNNQPTDAPTGTTTQKLCEGSTLADIAVAGTNIQWYSSPNGGTPLGLATVVQDGDIYYATQTVDACESDTRLEVTVFVLPNATVPTGNENQTYIAGQTIADLVVTGSDLIWYEDEEMTQEITDPASFLLENYETYYVSQSPAGHCESEVLAITVHEELGTRDPVFAELTYHPNPMKHTLSVSNTDPIESVALYDLLGRKVMEHKVNNNKINLDVSNLQSGTYFLWVNIDGKTGVFKLLKE